MLNLLFSPNGRLSSGEFMKLAAGLIVLGVLFSLPQLMGMSPVASSLTTLLGLVSYYCWVVIWIKRYHDAGKPGVMCLIPIAVYIVLATIVSLSMMGNIFTEMMNIAAEGGAMTPQEQQDLMRPVMLPMIIGNTIVAAIVAFGFNAIIKHDPSHNQYGPSGSGDTFD